MLQRQLLDRFLIAAAALGAWALATPAVDVAAADEAQVTVIAPGGSQQSLSLAALAGSEDIVDRPYLLRTEGGESTQTVTGFSLAALLEAAGADPYAFSYLEVLRPAGGAVLLSRDQALDAGAFSDGPPVVYATAAGTAFLRPNSGGEDRNGSDSFEAPQGVTIALRKGEPLRVRAEASTLRTRPGKAVEFTAFVDRAGAGESLTFSWYFDDGHSASGVTARHAFSRRGSYDVVVGVTTPGDDTGASAVVTVQVGEPLSGPDRKGGGTDEDAAAPDHGAATGSSGPSSRGAGGPGMSPLHGSAEQRRQSPERAPRRRPETAVVPGEHVSGRLLSASAPPVSEAPSAAARTGKLSENEEGGVGLPGAALAMLVTAGLFGAGALIEARSLG